MGLWPRRGRLGATRPRTGEGRAGARPRRTGGFDKRAIDTLSGGQLQRALFARVLVQEADIVLLDEPFNAVDAKTVGDLVEVIKGWQAEGLTAWSLSTISTSCAGIFRIRCCCARRDRLGTDGRDVTAENLQRARRFDEAWHEDAPWCEPTGADHGPRPSWRGPSPPAWHDAARS